MDFLKRLENERLIFDGAMGTMLQDELAPGEHPVLVNMKNPDKVLNIHKDYLRAGCSIIKTNTFGANRLNLSDSGYSVHQVISTAVSIAKNAVSGTDNLIALDIGPLGKLLAPFGDLDFEEAVDIFSEMIRVGTGADLVLIETMSDTYEIKAAMLAVKENCDLPLLVTFTPYTTGRLLNGADIQTAVCLIESLGASALGFNCGFGPKQLQSFLPELIHHCSIPIIISPNAGIPEQINGKTEYRPEEFALEMAELAHGAHIIGGCCGTSPEHLAAAVRACKDIALPPVKVKNETAVCSYGETVAFGGKTVIIGERLNPTGKPCMKKALIDCDMNFFFREGLEQAEQGAQILDVNVGMPGIDEGQMLAQLVYGLQSVTKTPLQIDTANTAAAERALRLYNGKALLNSVNGKKESLETMLPLVKKYGAAVVALCLDDDGIPETMQGRIQIAEKIIAAAASYGIQKKDIIVDALTMTISTGDARVTLDTVEYLRHKMGIHTVLGVSNVSFGLPGREQINAAFFLLAMKVGLSAGIVNPLNRAIMDAVYQYQAINGADENCAAYIAHFSGQGLVSPATVPSATVPSVNQISLHDAILRGLKDQSALAAALAANDMSASPMEIINAHIIPALDKAGKNFEAQKIFLPQLLMSAEAAKTAFEALRMSKQDSHKRRILRKRGKIVLATVKGDVHDIGKNIVKILLENYNYQVIDLGKNVDPSLVLETVLRERVTLAGLSALMTTTVVYMEETIKLLKEKAPNCRVMAGGAVLTKSYADKIGADFYSKDAISAVRYAEEVKPL